MSPKARKKSAKVPRGKPPAPPPFPRALVTRALELLDGAIRPDQFIDVATHGSTSPPLPALVESEAEAERLLLAAYDRMREAEARDAPMRAIRFARQTETIMQKALGSGKGGNTAALGAARDLRRLAALRTNEIERTKIMDDYIGKLPDPKDPTMSNAWANRMLTATLEEIYRSGDLDPSFRYKLIVDGCAKIGMTYSKAAMEAKADRIEKRVAGPEKDKANELGSTDGIRWPATSRFGRADGEPRSVRGDRDDPPPGQDG